MPWKLQILVNKLDALSDEDFHHYWSEEHPKIWLNVPIVKKNITSYSQFHVDRKQTDALKEHGLPVGEWDGIVVMESNSVEELMSVFQDEEYNRVVVADEQKFLKRQNAILMLGEEKVKKRDGEVLVQI